MENFLNASELVKDNINKLRKRVPHKLFNKNLPAEVEVNKFYLDGESVDRVMIVLRANGCEHYKKTGGCSMCSHYNGTIIDDKITDENYKRQWNSILNSTCFEGINNFDLDNFPIVCIYNLGSLLNENEVSFNALRYIFSTLNEYKNVKKVIIESRAEYVTREALSVIKENFDGLIEVGIGVESTNDVIRELCHSKGCKDIGIMKEAVEILHEFNYKALAYVNFKPCFLTERESIDDAIKTSVDCFNMKFDAVSIEPTSLQEYSLTNHLNLMGYYRVPWLWSLSKIIHGINDQIDTDKLDIRLGGYFDEEILSGSQGEGFAGRNEIFPYKTSSNCSNCTPEFINHIKKFNTTYDVADLDSVEKCDCCYNLWETCYNVEDSRSIPERIIDILGDSYSNNIQ
ncbi:hypothetical protein [Clostridium butyricum]|uniref:hypothetical protein n=1 Tax=Clostridium butyricum TaxID=1492 RepID=UPI002AAFF929|nr:hypothetical protein [Clostridium butyricum]